MVVEYADRKMAEGVPKEEAFAAAGKRMFWPVVNDAKQYSRVDMVERRGEFAVRGGIVDVFPPTEEHPLRVELFEDCIYGINSPKHLLKLLLCYILLSFLKEFINCC